MDSTSYQPVSAAHPGETVLDYLEAFGWSQRELSRRCGLTAKTISEICSGKASISTATAFAFEKVLGRPAHFWMNLQCKYDEIAARNIEAQTSKGWHSWAQQFPIKEMRDRGWIYPTGGHFSSDVLEILRFLGVSSPDSWNSVWKESRVSYRQTRKFSTNDYAISAWVRAVELIAEQIEVREYNKKELVDSLQVIRSITRLRVDEGFEKVRLVLAQCGVAFVWEPALAKTGISGCTRWLNADRALVAISLRYKSDDQIWFTLFHELGHVLLHKAKHNFIMDNADDNLTDNVVDPEMQLFEDEANRFASNTLIPADLLNKFISFGIFSNESIHEFAEAIDISPGVVVGRLQREGLLESHQGNRLKQRVDWSFNSSEARLL